MAKFRLYNIQLLPNSDESEVGIAGYKKLFSALRDKNREMIRDQKIKKFHPKDAKGNYIGPFEFNFPAGFVWGVFKKYSDPSKVVDIKTGKTIIDKRIHTSAVTDIKEAFYVFDTKRHLLAIEEGRGALPSPKEFESVLSDFLYEIAEETFPNYTLSINLISEPGGLERIRSEATGYKSAKISLNEPNGAASDLLEEMQRKRIKKMNLDITAGRGGVMKDLPEIANTMLKAATSHGEFNISYTTGDINSPNLKVKNYNSQSNPRTFVTRQGTDEDMSEYMGRIYNSIPSIE